MTFPTVAFAYRLHLSHTLFKVIPKSIGLGRHGEESRSGGLKLQMSVRRHSGFFPLIVHVQSSTLTPLLTRSSCEALAAKAAGVLLPVAYILQHKKSDPLDKSFYPHRPVVLFFLNERF